VQASQDRLAAAQAKLDATLAAARQAAEVLTKVVSWS